MWFRRPRPELAGVRRARCARPPQRGVAGVQGRVDHGADRGPQVVAVDEQPAGTAQRDLGVGLYPRDRRGAVGDPLDAHVRAQPERAQQQPAPQHIGGSDGAGGHRGELTGEPGGVVDVLDQVQEVDDTPPPGDLLLQLLQVLRLGLADGGRDRDPRLALLLRDPHAAGGALPQPLVQPAQRRGVPFLEVGDEVGRIAGLGQRLVVHVPVVLEVDRQVVVGVTPGIAAFHPDLPPPDRRAQRHQDAQLIRDPLDQPGVGIDDRFPPVLGHHVLQRHHVRGGVEVLLGVRVPLQQGQGVHDRPEDLVTAAERHRPQQLGQSAPGVGAAQLRADPGIELLLVRLGLSDDVLQRPPAHHRVQGLADDFLRQSQRRRRELHQDPVLAVRPPELRVDLSLDLLLRPHADLVDQLDQQLHETVGELRLPHLAQRRQQRAPDRLERPRVLLQLLQKRTAGGLTTVLALRGARARGAGNGDRAIGDDQLLQLADRLG